MRKVVCAVMIGLLIVGQSFAVAEDGWTCLYDGIINSMKFCMQCGRSKEEATSWVCPSCGNENTDSANYCIQCGFSMLEAFSDSDTHERAEDYDASMANASERVFSLSDVSFNGAVAHFTWTDSASAAPYNVSIVPELPGQNSIQSMCDTPVFDTKGIIPGQSYSLMIVAADGIVLSDEVQMPTVETFADGALEASSLKFAVFRTDVNTGRRMSYTAEEVSAVSDYTPYGLRLNIDYPKLSYTRNYDVFITICAPNGYVDVFDKGQIELDSRNSPGTKNLMVAFDSYLIGLKSIAGRIPAGTYTVKLYFNGLYVATDTFDIQ